MLGTENARLIIESHGDAIRMIEKIVDDEKIDCEFMRCDNAIFTEKGFAEKGKESDAHAFIEEEKVARTLGLEASVEPADGLSFSNAGSLSLKDQAKFHPLKFLAGLAIAAQKAGVTIYEHTEVSSLATNDNGVTVRVGTLSVKAAWALSASYEPFREPWALYFKKAMYASYVMELKTPSGSLKEGTYEDTENPYHYFRVDHFDTHDRIIIGGEDHRLDIPVKSEKNFAALERYIGKTFPLLSYETITRWQGHVLEPIDGRAFIGSHQDNHIWYAFGFSGNGMTYAAIAAKMFCDAVTGTDNPWGELYSADRILGAKSLWIKGRDYAGEFIHGALYNTFTRADSIPDPIS